MINTDRQTVTAVGMGAAAIAFIEATGLETDFELFLVTQSGISTEIPPGCTWKGTLAQAKVLCARVSHALDLATGRRQP